MLRLMIGRARTGKTGRVIQEISRHVREGTGGDVLLVPEQYSHEAERELCAACGDSLSQYAEVLSFTGLCRRVEEETGRGGPLLDKGGRLLCMSLALQAVSTGLQTYRGAQRRPETQRLLLRAVDELKSACASAEMLRDAAAQAEGGLSAKLSDLSLIMGAYDAVTARTGIDPADRLTRLARALPQSTYGRGSRFYVDGFVDFTRQELEVLRVLLGCGAELTVCLTCDGADGDSEVFTASRRTIRLLQEMARRYALPCTVEQTHAQDDGPLRFLERHLFDYTPQTLDAGGRVVLLRAASVTDECACAAARCRELVRRTGCRWRDIAIAVRGYEQYRPALESAFARYGVPLFSAQRTDLLSRPLPALIAAAFEVIEGGWEADDVFDMLRTGLFGLTPEETDELENYVFLWSLRGSAWTRASDWSQHPSGWGVQPDEASEAALRRINALRRRVAEPVQALAEAGRRAQTAAGQAAALADFLQALKLPQRLQQRADELTAGGEQVLAGEYAQLWQIVINSLEQAAAVLGQTPMEQAEFSRLYLLLLSQYDVGLIPVSLDCVSAGDLDRMRRRRLRHLILLGASDTRLPRIPDEAGTFSCGEREQLRAWGIELGDAQQDIDREFNLIYNCLTLPSESLCVTWPAGETPSLVVSRLQALYGLQPAEPDMAAVRGTAPGPALELAALALQGDERALPRAALAYFDGLGETGALRAAAAAARGRLSERAVLALYGDRVRLTATGMEKLASCGFAYYLQYGLRARPRRPAGFQPPEMGTFVHFVLEHVARELTADGGFDNPERERVDALTDRFVRQYVSETLNDFREKSARFIYLFGRLRQTVRCIVWDMVSELACSDFRPLAFEMSFDEALATGPQALQLQMRGKVDRVDGWYHDGRLYLRVMDYKTGRKSFDLSDVWYGMNLQMLLYLFTLVREGPARFGCPVEPAGVLYVPARDALIAAESREDGQAQDKRARALRRSGLLLSDPEVLEAMEHGTLPRYLPIRYDRDGQAAGDALASAEQLGVLCRHIDGLLARMAGELGRGGIAADPWFRTLSDNACLHCDYLEACHFDEDADCRRQLSRLRAPEVWQRLGKEGEHG